MSEIVDLQQAKAHLDVEAGDWDNDIELKLDTAEGLVLRYITVAVDDLTEAQANQVRSAILLVLGVLWNNRDGGAPLINETVEHVLYGLRDPTLA